MPVYEHLTELAGKRVEDWDADKGVHDPAAVAYRIGVSYDRAEDGITWTDELAAFLDDPRCGRVEALVVGPWPEVATGTGSEPVVEALVGAREKLPSLRAIFLGDIIGEESEISWITQSDVSPLLIAYPALRQFWARGSMGLSLGSVSHAHLDTLVVQSGGLGAEVVRQAAGADLPALEHLELWLGEPNYGADWEMADLQPLLRAERFPRLRYLGLKNSDVQDELATILARAPVTTRLEVLDLSMGNLSDAGAKPLAESPAVARLKKLDIHHHYVSAALVDVLKKLGIEVDASDPQKPYESRGETMRFIAVGE